MISGPSLFMNFSKILIRTNQLQRVETMETHRLINFRAPIAIQTMFDQVCDYQCQTRTTVLISLMSGYISQRSEEIQKQIASVNALKKDLLEIGNSRNLMDGSRNQKKRFYPRSNEFEDDYTPMAFFADQGT